jgi:outer membrane protein assembly factor BamD (BamD/ComL family)
MNVCIFAGLLLLSLVSFPAYCQDSTTNLSDSSVLRCSQEQFEDAAHIYRDTVRNRDARENKLKKILDECPDAGWYDQVSEFLRSAREDRAQVLLEIAAYYQNLICEGKPRGLKAAESRYKQIVQQYSQFSKIDDVLIRLGDVQTARGEFDDAWLTYTKLINEFPASNLVKTAFQRLQVLQEIRLIQPNLSDIRF